MKNNKIIIVFAIGIILVAAGIVLSFTNSDKKEKEKETTEEKVKSCETALQNNNKRTITVEVDEKKIEIPVLDCVEEVSKTEEEVTFSSKDNKYQVKVKEWQSDIETLSDIMFYNYSLKENCPSYLLVSENITTENGIKYKLVQAHEEGENGEITLKTHTVLYTVNENITLSIEFTYTIDELPAEHFSEIVDNIKKG